MSDDSDNDLRAAAHISARAPDLEIRRLRAENEKLKKENWEHIACGYSLINMLPDETLVGEVQDARRIIGGIVDSLRAENEKLRTALKPFVTAPPSDAKPDDYDWLMVRPEDIRAAAAALKETSDD